MMLISNLFYNLCHINNKTVSLLLNLNYNLKVKTSVISEQNDVIFLYRQHIPAYL